MQLTQFTFNDVTMNLSDVTMERDEHHGVIAVVVHQGTYYDCTIRPTMTRDINGRLIRGGYVADRIMRRGGLCK